MLKNLKIRFKLLLLLAVPIVGLLIFSLREVGDKYQTLRDLNTTHALTGLAVRVGALAHEFQKERGLSSGYLTSRGERFRDDLARQRVRVDAALQNVSDYAAANGAALDAAKPSLEAAAASLAKLRETRAAIDNLGIAGKESFGFYTGLIASYLDVVAAVATTSGKDQVMREATAYYAFVKAKEEMGQERATLNAVLVADHFDDETFRRTLLIMAAQESYLEMFGKFAAPAERAAYEDQARTAAFNKVEALRAAILAKGMRGGFGIAPEQWFGTITAKIEAMKEVEDRLEARVLTTAANLAGDAKRDLAFSLAIATLLAVAALGLAFLVMLSITTPLRHMLHLLQEIAEGDGDLTRRLDEARRDEYGELAHWFNRFVDNIHGIIGQATGTTAQVSLAAGQLHTTADQIATAAEQVAGQSATVATAGEEMSATSHDIAINCSLASEVANRATGTAREGAEVVLKTVRGMEQIAERVRETALTVRTLGSRSDQIGAIVGTIEDIADQTNLLALNAAIEAARAGEQGRGFAVVADEVRALAERTTTATREIGEMIKAIQRDTAGAVGSMENGVQVVEEGMVSARRSGEALQQIVDAINEVTGQVHQIATAAEEQTAVTAEISGNIHQITGVVAETARGAHQTAGAASQLSSLADELQRMVARFRLA